MTNYSGMHLHGNYQWRDIAEKVEKFEFQLPANSSDIIPHNFIVLFPLREPHTKNKIEFRLCFVSHSGFAQQLLRQAAVAVHSNTSTLFHLD
jgi:hypothetical protein